MVTRAKDRTAKAATTSRSRRSRSILRAKAPQIRTTVALLEKHEQIQDALEHESIQPRVAQQMDQTLKGIMAVAKLELQYFTMLMKLGARAPVPRSPILRSLIGLPVKPSKGDAEAMKGVIAAAG